MGIIDDLRAEGAALHTLLARQDEEFFERPTAFKGWSANDILGHLHVSDHWAITSARSREAFAGLRREMARGGGPAAGTAAFLDGARGHALLERWRGLFLDMCAAFEALPEKQRLAWFGPDMSVRSFASARQMETWAHGQAIYDLLAVRRENTDRLRNVAIIGVNTFAWTFANRKLEPPGPLPHVRLSAPSGALWSFGEASEIERIEGDAVEFCQVVTQTRNVADTRLRVSGDTARAWMSIAQCFAGPPVDPPAPGARGQAPASGRSA